MPFTGSALVELLFLFIVSFLIPTFNFISPFRPIIVIIGLSTHLPFLTVGIVASLGSALGALPLYFVGRKADSLKNVHAWVERHRRLKAILDWTAHSPFLTILCLLWFPFPDQLVGLYGGYLRYPLIKFLVANLIGRAVWYIPLAYFGTGIMELFWKCWHAII